MKAIMVTNFGSPDVLQVRTIDTPEPKANEVLVQVHAYSVAYGDVLARRFKNVSPREFNMPFLFWVMSRLAFGLRKPNKQILGAEFAGTIAAVGTQATRFKVGDAVFGYRGLDMGTNAEYVCMAENGLIAPKPANISFEEAASIPYGALTALNLLRKVAIQPGQKVLIVGASGGIGSAAVQLAKHYGAAVTGVCSSSGLSYVKALGADTVIDYTKEDFTGRNEQYDIIIDILGRGSFTRAKRVLTANGRYLYASFKLQQLLQMLWTSRTSGPKVICALSMEQPADLLTVKDLVEAGDLKSIIDRSYPFDQTADAHRYFEAGHKHGSVVVSLAQGLAQPT